MRLAVGTSLMIITATSAMALIAHLVAGRTLDVGVTAAMTVASIVGALAGVRLAGCVPQRQLGTGFAHLVVLVASYLLVSAPLLGDPSPSCARPARPNTRTPVLRQAVLVGVADGLGAVAGAGLVEDPVDVGLDGCVAEDELVCDLVVR